MQLVAAARRMHAGVEGQDDAVGRAGIRQRLVRQPGRKHHQLAGQWRHIHLRRLQVGIAQVHVGATECGKGRAVKPRHTVGCAEHRVGTAWRSVVHLHAVHARPRAVAVGVHIMKGAVVADLAPQAVDVDGQIGWLRAPGGTVGLGHGAAQAVHQKAHKYRPFGQLDALQQVIVTGKKRGVGGLVAGGRLGDAQRLADARQQWVHVQRRRVKVQPQWHWP